MKTIKIITLLLVYFNVSIAQQQPDILTNMFENVGGDEISKLCDSYLSIDGYTYIVAKRGSTLDQTVLLKIGPKGNLIWAKKYSSDLDSDGINTIIPSTDGNNLFITSYIDDILSYRDDYNQITRIDTAGNVIWSKRYDSGDKDLKMFMAPSNISTDIYYVFSDIISSRRSMNIYKINGNGVVLNEFAFHQHTDADAYIKNIHIDDNDKIHIVSDNDKIYGFGHTKFDENLNLISNTWGYIDDDWPNEEPKTFDVKSRDGFTYIFGFVDDGGDWIKPLLLKLDSLNNVLWSELIDINISTSYGYLKMDGNGDLYAVFADVLNNNYILKLDSGGNMIAQKKIIQQSSNLIVSDIIDIGGQDFFSVSSLSNSAQVYNTVLNTDLYHCNLIDVDLNLYIDSVAIDSIPIYWIKLNTYSANSSPVPVLLPFQQYSICLNEAITECDNCVPSFSPEPGKYIVSVWVKEKNPMDIFHYSNPEVVVEIGSLASFSSGATGEIIEGWQKIEFEFEIPQTATPADEVKIYLKNNGLNDVYFDDLRIHPVNATMNTYVYDPATMRLKATLDENNYATFYEYDKSGKLERVKKETNRGIFTIQESRQAVVK